MKTNTWLNSPDKGTLPSNFASNYSCVHYNSVCDRLIVILFAAEKKGVCVFDPETGAWDNEPTPLPSGIPTSCGHGFYSPEVNAHFLYTAGDSREDNGTMWAYRYKNGAK